ncbi:hypothetical protein FOZ61_001351, partial [Perkinsus olseni]
MNVAISPELWPWLCVVWRNRCYCLRVMGFGLNIAPKTLQLIMQAALKDEEADAYLDDIYVPFSSEDPSRLDRIQQNLLRHNLPTKSPEDLAKARVLGLQLFVGPDDVLYWKRRSGQHMDLLLKDTFTLRQLLSWSGKLVEWVDTSSNLADTLCRVPQRWIVEEHQLQTPQLAAMGVSYCLEPIVSFGKMVYSVGRIHCLATTRSLCRYFRTIYVPESFVMSILIQQ